MITFAPQGVNEKQMYSLHRPRATKKPSNPKNGLDGFFRSDAASGMTLIAISTRKGAAGKRSAFQYRKRYDPFRDTKEEAVECAKKGFNTASGMTLIAIEGENAIFPARLRFQYCKRYDPNRDKEFVHAARHCGDVSIPQAV